MEVVCTAAAGRFALHAGSAVPVSVQVVETSQSALWCAFLICTFTVGALLSWRFKYSVLRHLVGASTVQHLVAVHQTALAWHAFHPPIGVICACVSGNLSLFVADQLQVIITMMADSHHCWCLAASSTVPNCSCWLSLPVLISGCSLLLQAGRPSGRCWAFCLPAWVASFVSTCSLAAWPRSFPVRQMPAYPFKGVLFGLCLLLAVSLGTPVWIVLL